MTAKDTKDTKDLAAALAKIWNYDYYGDLGPDVAAIQNAAPELRTALLPFDASANWLPIESAPKDRIIILRNGKTVSAGFFDENETRYKWAFLDWAFLESTSKQFGGNLDMNGWCPWEGGPTHWQELPAAPGAT